MRGVETLDLMNIGMIMLTLITLSLKYGYDDQASDKLKEAYDAHKIEGLENGGGYVEFSTIYLYYEIIAVLDSILGFLMAISILKYTSYWIPSLHILTNAFKSYFSSTIKRIFYFICLLSLAFSLYFHYFYSYVCFGFQDLAFTLIRTNLLFVQGPLFNKNTFYLQEETLEYVYQRLGWGAVLVNIGVIHFFGRYVIMSIITAFMKKDINAAVKVEVLKEREKIAKLKKETER